MNSTTVEERYKTLIGILKPYMVTGEAFFDKYVDYCDQHKTHLCIKGGCLVKRFPDLAEIVEKGRQAKRRKRLPKTLKKYETERLHLWQKHAKELLHDEILCLVENLDTKGGTVGDIDGWDILPESVSKEIDFLLKWWQCESQFSAKLFLPQQKAILSLGLLRECFSSGKLDIAELSSVFRSEKYFPEHFTYDRQTMQLKRNTRHEMLLEGLREIYSEHGEDVKTSELFKPDQWHKLKQLVRKCDLDDPDDDDIFAIFGDDCYTRQITPEERLWPTPFGYVVRLLTQEMLTPGREAVDGKMLRELLVFYGTYSPPDSYKRILYDYYDHLWGFLSPSQELLEQEKNELDKRHILPQYLHSPFDDNKYWKFKEILIERKLVTADELSRIEDYYRRESWISLQECMQYLEMWPFVITMRFKKCHRALYDHYLHEIHSWLNQLTEHSNDSLMKQFLAHDVRCKINGNLLFACVFYDFILDGKDKLKRKLKANRPTEDCLNNIAVFLIELLAKGDNKRVLPIDEFGLYSDKKRISHQAEERARPFTVAKRYCEMLMGDKLPSLRNRYYNWKKNGYDPSIFKYNSKQTV